MSKENNKDPWSELAKKMNESAFGGSYDSKNKTPSEPDLLKAAEEAKKMFNAFTEAGFTSVQVIRLLAEMMRGGN